MLLRKAREEQIVSDGSCVDDLPQSQGYEESISRRRGERGDQKKSEHSESLRSPRLCEIIFRTLCRLPLRAWRACATP